MKKLLDKRIVITFMVTAIIFSGIGVVAGTQFFAKDVVFTPSKENQDKGWEVNNVEDALNDLYSNKDLKYYTSAYGGSIDTTVANKTTITQALEKGNYYLMAIVSSADGNGYEFTLNGDVSSGLISISGCTNLQTLLQSFYGENQNTSTSVIYGNQSFSLYQFTMEQDDNIIFDYDFKNDRNIVLHFFKA